MTRAEDEALRRADAARLMELPEFQRFAYWLLFRLSPVDAPPAEGISDSVRAFRDGRRSVSVDIGRVLLGPNRENLKAWHRMEQQAPKLQDSPDSSDHG